MNDDIYKCTLDDNSASNFVTSFVIQPEMNESKAGKLCYDLKGYWCNSQRSLRCRIRTTVAQIIIHGREQKVAMLEMNRDSFKPLLSLICRRW